MSSRTRTFKFRIGALAILSLALSQSRADDAKSVPLPTWPSDFSGALKSLHCSKRCRPSCSATTARR